MYFEAIEQFERLLAEYATLPRRKEVRTFMQVAGYPHYENVCSNILAFYFDPDEEHGMGDMLLRALMECLRVSCLSPIPVAKTKREVRSDAGLKLDLVITGEDFIIGIEHKIWAPLYNDLGDYAKLLASRAREEEISAENIHRVVLSLRRLAGDELARLRKAHFINITHVELISKARDLIGHYAAAADTKFLTYFTDFMATLEALSGPAPDTDSAKFFRTNFEKLRELHSAYWGFISERPSAVGKLLDELLARESGNGQLPNQWIHSESTLVNDTKALNEHAGKLVSVYAHFGLGGWSFTVFCRMEGGALPADCLAYFQQIQPLPNTEGFTFGKKGLLKSLPATTPDIEVAQFLKQLLCGIMQALGYARETTR